jgi:uncharacterized protein (DUF952 family)
MNNKIYKILNSEQWKLFQKDKILCGSEFDLKDGFIHLSFEYQVERVLRKYFANQSGLVLLEFDSSAYKNNIKLEKNSLGDLYPHLYGSLQFKDILQIKSL